MRKYLLIALAVLFLMPTLLLARGKEEEKAKNADLIPFEVLKEWTIPFQPQKVPPRGTGMIILVSEKATKDEVMKLATRLRERYISRYTSKDSIYIDIFDSKEAWLNRDNPKYPSAKFDRHWLVNITVNPNTGYDKITWTAIGRKH